jgi:GNAT superfamily N-acetyltransferase
VIFSVTTLDPSTWEVFAELVERNNGVYGGCWCLAFHPEGKQRGTSRRQTKEERVRTDRAHAALVIGEDGLAQGWTQYGDPEELAAIKHRIAYQKDPPRRPDWRITCVFVDPAHRGQGVARLALEGALEQIAARGGGLVEAISEVTEGRQAQGRFLFSATAEVFDELGSPASGRSASTRGSSTAPSRLELRTDKATRCSPEGRHGRLPAAVARPPLLRIVSASTTAALPPRATTSSPAAGSTLRLHASPGRPGCLRSWGCIASPAACPSSGTLIGTSQKRTYGVTRCARATWLRSRVNVTARAVPPHAAPAAATGWPCVSQYTVHATWAMMTMTYSAWDTPDTSVAVRRRCHR